MFTKLKNLLLNNIGFKFLSLLFALILWLVVVNIDDPDKTKSFSTSVTLANEDVIAEMGKCYEILGDTNVVSFRVTAKRSILERLSASDFKATADMENIDLRKDGKAVVPIDITSSRYGGQLDIDRDNKNLEIALEELQSNQFKILSESTGEPAEGCAIGEIEVLPDVITISGPASLVSQIYRIQASIDVSGMFEDTESEVVPVLYDVNGNVLDTSKLTLSQETVKLKAQILSVKQIPINCETSGELGEEYKQVSVTCEPKEITVKGTAELLNRLTMVQIPSEALDISGAKETLTKTIDIGAYLPEGVSLVDSSQAKVQVTVEIEQVERKTYQVPVKNIKIFNLPSSYEIEYQGDKIPVTLLGYTSDIEGLEAADIQLSIDVADIDPGTNIVPLSLNMGSELALAENSVVTINLIDTNLQQDENAQENGNAQGSGNAQENGNAQGSGNAQGDGDAQGSGNAQGDGDAQGSGNAQGDGDAQGSGNAQDGGNAQDQAGT